MRGTEWTLPVDRGFTGQVIEPGLGLHDYGARHLAQPLGRWIAPDTIVPDPADPQSLNRYGYVLNNPLRYSDPSGHCVFAPPWDTLVCVLGFTALALKGDATSPSSPPDYPKNYSLGNKCTASLSECFGDFVQLKDFENNGPDNPIPMNEFEKFAHKVAEDLYTHDVDWPGLSGGRDKYDTPFYNGGQSTRRTYHPGAEQGVYPANQQVCIAGIGCAGRSEVNYIAQGMWAARVGEPQPISKAVVWAWKLWEYQDKPSPETIFWLQYGYDYYLHWLEQQQANGSTP